jgi:hypothetical protein
VGSCFVRPLISLTSSYVFPHFSRRDNGLSLFVHAATRDERFSESLAGIVDAADVSLQQWLTANSGTDVCMAYVQRGDKDRASAALSKFLQHTVDSWSSLSPLAVDARAKILSSLQTGVELHEYLSILRRISHAAVSGGHGVGDIAASTITCLNVWMNRYG